MNSTEYTKYLHERLEKLTGRKVMFTESAPGSEERELSNMFYDIMTDDEYSNPQTKWLNSLIKQIEDPSSQEGAEWSDQERDTINKFLKQAKSGELTGADFDTGFAEATEKPSNITANEEGTAIVSPQRLERDDEEEFLRYLSHRYPNLQSLGSIQFVGFDLSNQLSQFKNLTDLGELEYVDGSLTLKDTNIVSLGNLKAISRTLDLTGASITSLDNLETVGSWLVLAGSKVRDIGKLQRVGGDVLVDPSFPQEILSNVEIFGGIKVK